MSVYVITDQDSCEIIAVVSNEQDIDSIKLAVEEHTGLKPTEGYIVNWDNPLTKEVTIVFEDTVRDYFLTKTELY